MTAEEKMRINLAYAARLNFCSEDELIRRLLEARNVVDQLEGATESMSELGSHPGIVGAYRAAAKILRAAIGEEAA